MPRKPQPHREDQGKFTGIGQPILSDWADLVVEMIEREDGLEVLTEEDHKMQKIFNELVVGAGSYVGARIGTRYLRRHPELFKVSDLRAPLLGS